MPIVPHRHQRLVDEGEEKAWEYDDGCDTHSLSELTHDAGRSASPRRATWRVKPKTHVLPCDGTGRNLRRACMILVVVAVVVLGTSVASFWKQASSASQLPGHVVKSASDPREYGSVHLPNGIQAILISDGKADRAAAALAVGVGSYADPRDALGLAHFLEHMLFMGSGKYPEENEYGAFLARHGGTSNAYTAAEITNYFFAVMPDYFDGALDRFSRFFIDPLLSPAAVEREKNAVDSEYRNDLSNDGWREEIAIRYSGNPESPFSQFNIGSLRPSPTGYPATLANVSRADLVQFHAQHYHASNMRLVVLGRESLAELTTMVEAKFSAVPTDTADRQTADDNDILLPRSLAPSLSATRTADSRPRSSDSLDNQRTQKEGEARWPPPFARAQRARAIVWLPQKHRRSLTLMWPLPPQRKLFKKKAPQFVASLLGDQGHGSVLAHLRKLQLAQSLAANIDYDSSSFAVFRIDLELLDKGLSKLDAIITLLFEYVSLIEAQGISQWRHDEMRQLAEIKLRFLDSVEPLDYVAQVSAAMHEFPEDVFKYVLAAPYVWGDMDAAAIRDVLKYLAPKNLVVALGAHDFGGGGGGGEDGGKGEGAARTGCIASCECLDKYGAAQLRQANVCKVEEEPFFGIPINFESFSDAALAAWSAARSKFARVGAAAPSVAPGPLALPIPNVFIAQDFTVKLSGGGGGRGGVGVGGGTAGNCCGGARASGVASCELAHVPEVVSARQGAVMWHQLEGTQGLFPQPKGVVKCLLETGTPDEVLGAYEQRLWIEAVGQVIQTAMYPARAAGLEVGFAPAERAGTVVSFSGFSDKMLGFVRAVLKTAAEFGEDEAAASLAVENARERLLEAVRNSNVSDAYRQAFDTTRRMLVKNAWTLAQAEDALTRASYPRVASFWRRTVGAVGGGGGGGEVAGEGTGGELRAECLFYGNFHASDALALEKAVQEGLRGGKEVRIADMALATQLLAEAAGVSTAGEDSLSMQTPLLLSEQVALEARAKVGLLPVGDSQVRRINQNGDDGNSGIEVHFALGHGARQLRDEARLVLLGSMIREPAFDQLRTKEQLGYAVFAFKRTILGYTGLSIIVQSPRAKTGDGGAAYLRERVDAFLRDYREVLANVSSTQLVQHKRAAASTLLQRPTDISDAAGRMWAEIEGGDYLFARASTLSVLIDSITPDSLRRFYDTLVMEPATRRRLTVLVSPAPARWPDMPATVGVLTDEGEQFVAWRDSLAAA